MAVVHSVVEKSVEAEVVGLREWVEFVVMALGAVDGEAEEGAAESGDAVHDGFDAELLGVDAAFLVDLGVAVETGGDLLLGRGVGEEIAGELLDDELIVGLVAVQ